MSHRPPADASAIRLSKRVAHERSCSRADAEALIVGGWVRVDGVVQESPQSRVLPSQQISVDARARAEAVQPVTLIWHKPAGAVLPEHGSDGSDGAWAKWINAETRWAQDASSERWLRVHGHRLEEVAPLGQQSSGLMALTQQPGVARRVADHASPLEHEWVIEVKHEPRWAEPEAREQVLRSLGAHISQDGVALDRARASWQSEWRLRLAIHGSRPGQVAHLCERAGVTVQAVRRQRLGRVGLAGLPVGQWRYMLPHERF